MIQKSPSLPKNKATVVASAALFGALLAFAGCPKQADAPVATTSATNPPIVSVEQRLSYGIGYNMGSNVNKQNDVKIDRDAFRAGIDDGMGGSKTRIPETDIQAAFTTVQQRVQAALAVAGEKQLAEGKDFLTKNRMRPGVTVTLSGLQYEVITKGNGPKPKRTDTVEVEYEGALIDGTVFDASSKHGGSATLQVGGVIAGWTEALQLMSVGDKWKLTIPPDIAYGTRPPPGIPPNAVLVFQIHLLAIK